MGSAYPSCRYFPSSPYLPELGREGVAIPPGRPQAKRVSSTRRLLHQALKALLVTLVLWAAPAKAADAARTDVAVLVVARDQAKRSLAPASSVARRNQASVRRESASTPIVVHEALETSVQAPRAAAPRAPRCPLYVAHCALLR